MKINVNNQIRVRLTDEGRAAYEKSYRDLGLAVRSLPKSGTMKLPLWEAMNIFGPGMIMGNAPLFVNNTITFLGEDGKPLSVGAAK